MKQDILVTVKRYFLHGVFSFENAFSDKPWVSLVVKK